MPQPKNDSTPLPFNVGFKFDNSYARDLEGFYAKWKPDSASNPALLQLNHALAAELGLDARALESAEGVAILVGNTVPAGATPLAQAYAGHQFGGFSPQLGDGRALLLGELIDVHGKRRDLQLKGSGRTPFSRSGDGKAAIGPVLREYLIGEAMHALGVPTTRALAAVATGDEVYRETSLPGAVLARVAASHLRVGTFEFFAARGETAKLRQLTDYALARHYPTIDYKDKPYLRFLEAVVEAQAALVARWMHIGFIHGVMNTDNVTISGETIDYGPCAFMDAYAPATVFSSIDRQGRYAYANQPHITHWNLARLAETFFELVDPDQEEAGRLLNQLIQSYPAIYQQHWLQGMRAKLGLTTAEDTDLALANGLLKVMEGQNADYTQVFRSLAQAVRGDEQAVRVLFNDPAAPNQWLEQWQARLQRENIAPEARAAAMDAVNPLYIPRNHKVEEALDAATRGDMKPFKALLSVLQHPFTEVAGLEAYTQPAPSDAAPYRTFCGT